MKGHCCIDVKTCMMWNHLFLSLSISLCLCLSQCMLHCPSRLADASMENSMVGLH